MKNEISRKEFLKRSGLAFCSLAAGGSLLQLYGDSPLHNIIRTRLYAEDEFRRSASLWKKTSGSSVKCELCPNQCELDNGERGICKVRENSGGILYTLVYARIASMHIDPIEKKPLNHFLPGSMALSVATAGCNLSCKFCQNWQLSQSRPEDLQSEKIMPAELADRAKETKSPVIAFTYNEPTVQYEYIIDTSREARKQGIRSIIISNGYINPEASKELVKNLDAVKIDFKGFTENFYRNICGGSLKPVMKNLETVYASGKWLETVTLVIPGLNDSPEDIRKMTRWVKTNLSPDVPMHFTSFHSTYLIKNLPPTPVKTLERCYEIARSEGIRYPYVGNIPGHKWENTYCHKCGALIVSRSGFFSVKNRIKNGKCFQCGTIIPGRWA